MSFQLHKSLVRLRNTIKEILDKNQEACDVFIWNILNCVLKTIKAFLRFSFSMQK